MLPRDRRVRTPEEFRRIRRTGSRAGRSTVVVSVAADTDPARPGATSQPRRPRAGFVVSKAVGNSVVRHRVTRRLRALLRAELDSPALRDRALLIQVKALPAAVDADHATLRRDVHGALGAAVRKLDQADRSR
ncbi:ribonuclease P protein component [Micrococcus porci]|uniref:ribonuclease P protein component n=1 Tax=Micrococcus porci TaxID=2856555 RepID=UPI001CC93CA5|nr:ribonuclease P protein component [Micrococcus porci]UBH24974.1 ribonuclease P protein component [Micrococcus porci]